MRRLFFIVGILLIGTFVSSNLFADKNSDILLAKKVASVWLGLVDSEKYSQSWSEASNYFRAVVTEDKWSSQMKAIRKPFGKRLSRVLDSSKYSSTLPGAPDGKYVVIKFVSSFENKRAALETVTSMQDKDGKWRVSGYFIK